MSTWNAILDYLIAIVTLKNVIIFSILYFFVIWISILVWVLRDILNRTDNIFLQIFSVLTVLLFTPLWIFLYLLIRPSKTLFEKYYFEVEDNLDYLWEDIVDKIWEENFKTVKCSKCLEKIREEFKYCPYCKKKIKQKDNKDKKIINNKKKSS